MLTYAIYRILGDELPPRDILGRRLEALQWILANEPKFPGCSRVWLLNVAADPALLTAYRGVLDAARELYTEHWRDWSTYNPKADRNERIRRVIDINGARNHCIWLGKALADVTFVLDGDCFFLQKDWDAVTTQIEQNQAGLQPAQYFSVPTLRVAAAKPEMQLEAGVTEPMLGFRADATLRFDEARRFGDGPKQELLWRLGHDTTPCQAHRLLRPGLCTQVGLVRHYANGTDQSENNVETRRDLRDEALGRLLLRAEALHCPPRP